jgi:hypothetical protein
VGEVAECELKVVIIWEELLDGFKCLLYLEGLTGFTGVDGEGAEYLFSLDDELIPGLYLNLLTNSISTKLVKLDILIIFILYFS